jgi:hypothetical protein
MLIRLWLIGVAVELAADEALERLAAAATAATTSRSAITIGIRLFKSLLIYTRGGGMIETSNTGTTRRGAALGQWERIGNDLFATSMWLFRFDPATGASLVYSSIMSV